KLGREHEIMLVDKKTEHRFSPSLPWHMMSWREPRQITRNLNLLNKKNIKYVNGEVLKIDPANRFLKTNTKDFACMQ
ncbi:MAG: NAD(P)/FAD-dependent oxidoreductase, partial [Candidatus Bathyarchaeota archaeon]